MFRRSTHSFVALVFSAVWVSLFLSAPAAAQSQPAAPGSEDLLELDIEQLSQQEVRVPAFEQTVTSVSRQESSVGKSPAAVFVITNEMIRRSGVTTVPEALRMAPGVNVAHIDSNKWAIGVRGFADRFSGKLLVQIDGRTVYTPINSGVYWDTVDVLLQDVERIEVIRGPGATVWGANAVNGVINIITKTANDTQGGLITGGGGTEERAFGAGRYGGQIGPDAYYRVWGKGFEHDHFFNEDGEARDDWRNVRGGFRADWDAGCGDSFTLQGDTFEVDSGRLDRRPQPLPPFVFNNIEDEISQGTNVLWRWNRELDDDANWSLQLYYDAFDRKSTQDRFNFEVDTYDLDFQYQFQLSCRQKIVCGLGYRLTDMAFEGTVPDDGFNISATAPGQNTNLYTAFVQDEVTVVDDLVYWTIGSKFEKNDYTGFEAQPTTRLLWTPTDRLVAWGAVSRAVRTPSHSEDVINITVLPIISGPTATFPRILGSPGFQSEDLIAYELGLRGQPNDFFSWDLALFYNVYDHLATTRARAPIPGPEPGTFILPLDRTNEMDGETYGFELMGTFQMNEGWRLYTGYSFLQMQLHRDAGIAESAEAVEGQSPQNQLYLQSSWDMGCHWEFDLIGRYVDNLPGFDPEIPRYVTMDARLAWKRCKHLEVAIVGQNLLDSLHPEFGTSPLVRSPVVEVERGVYGSVTARW